MTAWPELREVTEMRAIDLDAGQPGRCWAEIDQTEDLADLRGLARAVMGDIRSKRSWGLAWTAGTTLAYHFAYRPFGLHLPESDHFARLVGTDILSPADMAGLQRLYTLAHAGCSTVMAWDRAQSRMVQFRSLDWPSAGAIARATRIFVGRTGDRTAFAAAGILGMAGFLTAVKPCFSMAINFAPWRGPSLSPHADPTFLVRQLMASPIATYHEAYRVIASWRPGAPVFISLCGIDRGEACVFEFGAAWNRGGRCHAVPMGEGDYLIQTNHFSSGSPFARHARAQASHTAWDDAGWDAHGILQTSHARRMLIDQHLRAAYGEPGEFDIDATLRTIFAKRPVWNHETAQWVRMVPKSGDIRAWVRH